MLINHNEVDSGQPVQKWEWTTDQVITFSVFIKRWAIYGSYILT